MRLSLLCLLLLSLLACGPAGPTRATISTNQGDIEVLLYPETSRHTDNFIKLANEGFYTGTLFHRVVPGFMIQGGDPLSKEAKPGQPLGMGGPRLRDRSRDRCSPPARCPGGSPYAQSGKTE